MGAKITCEDGNDNILKTQIIPFTDFKDTEVIFWLENETLFQNDKTTLKIKAMKTVINNNERVFLVVDSF
jgi:hypothetical protein